MAPMSIFAVVVLICSALAAVSAQKSYVTRYPLGGGVDKYKKLADEMCAISDAASAAKFDEVKKLYVKSKADAGYSDSLQAFATSDFTAQRYYGLAAKYYGGAGWLNAYILSAIEGNGDFKGANNDQREQGIMKTAQSGLGIQLMLKEIDSASTDLSSGNKDGAVKALDESYAVFASRPTCGPYNMGDKYANQFGTIANCEFNTSTANIKIVDGYIGARGAAKQGDKAQFETFTAAILQGVTEVHIQAVLNYAKKMSGSADTAKALELQTEGYVFYRTIAPFVAQASPKADQALVKALKTDAPSATSYATIKQNIESVVPLVKANAANIGAWVDSPKVTCPAKSAAASVSVKAVAAFSGLLAAVLAALL